jgi:threonyl-tRNA synthetase
MIRVTLPDGSVREVAPGLPRRKSPPHRTRSGQGRACRAIDGQNCATSCARFEEDTQLALVTSRDEADALELVRHDFAHIMAEAVQNLFPGTQITFGPSTDDGFYYDFAPKERTVHR